MDDRDELIRALRLALSQPYGVGEAGLLAQRIARYLGVPAPYALPPGDLALWLGMAAALLAIEAPPRA